jgi:hypothetical protein
MIEGDLMRFPCASRLVTAAALGICCAAVLSSCADPGSAQAPQVSAKAGVSAKVVVGAQAAPTPTGAAAVVSSYNAATVVTTIEPGSDPQSSVCAYRHVQDGISVQVATAQDMAPLASAGETPAKALATALGGEGTAPIFTKGATVTETTVLVTQAGQAHDAALGPDLTNRPVYLVNFTGIHDLVSGKPGAPPIWANSMEVYVDANSGLWAMSLLC